MMIYQQRRAKEAPILFSPRLRVSARKTYATLLRRTVQSRCGSRRREEERRLFSVDCKKDLNVEEFGKRLFAWWLGKITCQNHCQASADEDADHGHDRVLGAQGREFEVGIGSPLRLAK